MSDPLLEAQLTTAFYFPVQTLCFVLGGLMVVVGLALATVMPSGKWKERGMSTLASGVLVAFPAVMPIALTLLSGSSDTSSLPLPAWFVPSLYVLAPIAGSVIGGWGWFQAGKGQES